MTSISSGSGTRTDPLGESTGSPRPSTVDRPVEAGAAPRRDGAGDAADLARTEATRPEAPGSGMTEGPRLELQQWASRLSDLTRELETLPAGSPEANAKLAEIRQHLDRLSALQSHVEEGLRSGPAALAQDYLLLLSSSRSALSFLSSHRSDPGSAAFGVESTLIGALQSRRDRSIASLRTLASERLLPSLRLAAEAEPSEQQVSDYRLMLRLNSILGECEAETLRLPREITSAYAPFIHPETVSAGSELPDYMRSSFFRDLDPHPVRTGTAPEAHSPAAEFPEGHPFRDIYRVLWENRGSSMSESEARRLIQQLQGLRGELAEGGRYGNFLQAVERGSLGRRLEDIENLLRNPPRTIPAEQFDGIDRTFHRLGSLEYQAQLQGSTGTSTRGRIGTYWHMYEEYRRLGNGEGMRGCLYEIYQLSQIGLEPENRTNGLNEADRHAIVVRFLEAYAETGRLDINFSSMMGSLGREITRLWEHGTEDSRFTALSLWTRYNMIYRGIEANYTDGTMQFLLLSPPHRILGTTEAGLPALLQDFENRARLSEDPNQGAARLIMVSQAYASFGDMGTCTAILRSVEDRIAAHPANEGNRFASRSLILGSFSSAGMSAVLGDYIEGWVSEGRAAIREAGPRDRAHILSETLQDWASLIGGLTEIGQPEMASRVFAALDAEMEPLTVESRARVYREILSHTSEAQREPILDRVRDLIGSDAERREPLSLENRVQLNSILGEFSTDPYEIQGAFSALTMIVRYENPSAEQLVEIHRYRLALRNHIHDLVRAHPDRLVEGSGIREMWLWVDAFEGRDGGSNAIIDDLTAARRTLIDRLGSVSSAGERRRILSLLNDSFREGMRMRMHGNDYGLRELVDQHLEMIRALRPSERPSVFADSLQFLNGLEVERAHARGREVTSFRNAYFDAMTAALPSLIADIPAGPERRSAILQFTRTLSQAREIEERRLRAAERALVTVRSTSAYHWSVEHGFDERFIGRTEAEEVDTMRPVVDRMRQMEINLWNQFGEGEDIPEARRVYEGFARAMTLTIEGRNGEARTAMTEYFSDPEVQAFLRSDPAGDTHRAEAQSQIQQLLDVSASILNGEAGARFDRTLRIVHGLARIRMHTLRAEGEEYPYDIGTIDRMTRELPRFLATLPPDRMPQTFEDALRLFGAANEGNARLVSEYNGAINRIPVQHVGSDGSDRTGSVWGLIRAMEHISDPGGADRAFAALQLVVADDTDWDLLSREGRGDLGPALQDFCDIIIDEGTNVSPELRQRVADFRARIPEEEEFGHFLRETFNWQLAVDIGLMALSGGIGGMARAAVSRIVIGLAERAALRMVSTTAIRFTMMAGRGLAYVGGHVASGVVFNVVHSSTSALILNRPFENPFSSGLRMSADSMINDPISMLLFSSIPGPSSMVGRFLYRQVATAITFQISQNIRYHAERGARALLDSDFHRALERRERMRAMYEATGDLYYQDQFAAAERHVTEIIGHEPDNSMRGIMLNIGMNIGQAGADHVMGTHHWAGHAGLEAPAHHGAESPHGPLSEADRAARRERHISLADALAATRASRRGEGREGASAYRGGAEEGPARAVASRRSGEEREFFRELVDLEVYEHYAPETLDQIVDQAARSFDPSGEPPALNEASRRFLRFFFTRVNPEHAGRIGPEGLATLIEAVSSSARRPASLESAPRVETRPVEGLPAERRPELDRSAAGEEIPGRIREPGSLADRIRDRESNPDAELGLRIMADEALGETITHLDDLLRAADPETLRTPEGRQGFLRSYREARDLLEAHPESLGGLRPHEALTALLGREGLREDLPTAARRLIDGEIRLRARRESEHGALPPTLHEDSPLRRIIAEETNARYQEESLREAARVVEHARREISELSVLLRSREGDPRFSAIHGQARDIRVRIEAAHRRVAEVRERIRELRRTERELSRNRLAPERRRELIAEANRLRRDIVGRIDSIRSAEEGVTRFVANARALERATPRPATEGPREAVRVELREGDSAPERRGTEAPPEIGETGPEIEIVDEGIRVELGDDDAARLASLSEDPELLAPHLLPPTLSANAAVTRMGAGIMAALGLGANAISALTPSTAHAQDAASGSHPMLADSSQFLFSLLHASPVAMTGAVATVALGFGAVYALFRRAARARAAERSPSVVRESATARSRASESTRGDADSGGQGRQQGDSRNESGAPEIPARMAPERESAVVVPEMPRSSEAEARFEGVLQDNAPGAPRRGGIEVREPSESYGTASAYTHEGVGYKDSNEDALVQGIDATGAHYAVVLDGMGGMGRGDQASRLAGEVIQREMSAHGDLMRAFNAAHEAVRREYRGAGACAVAHRVFRGADGRLRMEIIHVGDSGAVVFGRDGRILHRTRDQSHVQMLADAGMIEGGELAMRTHPDVNVVLGGLGTSGRNPPERHEIILEGGERVVMFSDGLGDNASTEEIVRRTVESSTASDAQQALFGLAQQRMGILDALYPQFDELPEGTRIPFTAPDGRTLYLARDIVTSGLQGETEMVNVYDAAEGGALVDHYKPDNVAVHVYFHDPRSPLATTPEVYIPTVVPAEGAPQPVEVAPPPRLGMGADPWEARTIDLLNRVQTPQLRPPARPGEAYHLHFPDLAGLVPIGTEAITGPTPIVDPLVAPRHAVIERIGPDQLVVQNLGDNQTFLVAPDGSYYPVGKYGTIIRNGQEIVMGSTRVRVTAEGRAPDPEAAHHFGFHPFRGRHSFSPDFTTGPQEGFGSRVYPEAGPIPGHRRGYAIESTNNAEPLAIRENPADPRSPWRTLAPGERHSLRFENGVSEEYRNAQGLVSRMTRHGEIVHVRGGEYLQEVEAPGIPPIEIPLGERERFVIGTRPESDVAMPRYGEANGRILLDPYLHVPSSNDPNLRFSPDLPADHAEVFRTPEGEWRIRNLSGAVIEVSGRGDHHFFLPAGAEMTLGDGQQIVFRGERPYRYRFRLPNAGTASPIELSLPRTEVRRRTSAWLEAPNAEALNARLAAEGSPFRIRETRGPADPEAVLRALAETPPTLALTFENGRLSPDSIDLLFAFSAMPESLRDRLRASAQTFDSMFNDLVLRENPLGLHYIRESARIFYQRVFLEGAPELAQTLSSLRPENAAETQAALARLFFWGPENLARESNLSLTGITGNDGFYLLMDASPAEFPDPVERARVQARIEAAREDGRRAQAEAELIRARIREHFAERENPAAPPLHEEGLRTLVGEMIENIRGGIVPEAAPEREAPPASRIETPVETVPATPLPSEPVDSAALESRRRGRQSFRALGDVLSAFSVRRSPELTAALENIRETLRSGDARELNLRLERARDIFSHPELRNLWEYAESLARGDSRGSAARDLLLAILDGRVLDVDQAKTFLRASQPALRLERRMRDVARDLNTALQSAGLGELAEQPALAEQALRPLLRRLFSDPSNPPSDSLVTRELLNLRDTLRVISRELERQPNLSVEMRRQLLEGYLVELAAGRMDQATALRLVDEGNAAARETTRRPTERSEEAIEIGEADFLPEPEIAAPLPETLPPPPGEDSVEIFASAALPAAVEEFLQENFSRPEQREAMATQARQRLPILRESLEGNGIGSESAEGAWILARLLVDTVRGQIETPSGPALREGAWNAESLQSRVETERILFQSIEAMGFEAHSREGRRLADFLYRQFARNASDAASFEARLALLARSDLREASDRLVLLGEARSAADRVRYLEWAIESGQTPESLQEIFWNTLRGVSELSLTPNGVEILATRGRRSVLAEIGQRVVETLDRLGVPAFSAEGTRLANALLARSAVDARPGSPRFGRLRIEEVSARAEALPQELAPVLTAIPPISATRRAETLRWALESGQSQESLQELGETLAMLPETRASDLLAWIVTSRQRPEGLRALRETLEAALDLEMPVTDVAGIRRLHEARLAETRRRVAAGSPRVSRNSRAYEVLDRYAFTQGIDTMMFERRPDDNGDLRLGLSLGGTRRARLMNFADPSQPSGPIVNLARRAERALRRIYESAAAIERLERESPGDPRLRQLRQDLESARDAFDAWENNEVAIYEASIEGDRIAEAQRGILQRLRLAIEPNIELFDEDNRPLELNAMQSLRDRILAIDDSEPDSFELADAWLDPSRGDQGRLPIQAGSLTLVVRERSDLESVARALETTIRNSGTFLNPELRLVTESDGALRLECSEAGNTTSLLAMRVLSPEMARRERVAEAARVERNRAEAPELLPIPAIRPVIRPAAPRPEAPAAGEREERPTRPVKVGRPPATNVDEAPPPASQQETQPGTPSNMMAALPANGEVPGQRPTLRMVRGEGHRRSEESPGPTPASSADFSTMPLAAGAESSSNIIIPSSLDPMTMLDDPARRDIFLDSLASLEAEGLIAPGTAVEDYRLPGSILRETGPNLPVHLSLRPGSSEADRFPYRIESIEDGILLMRRIGEDPNGGLNAPVEVALSHGSSPFRESDYVFLRFGDSTHPLTPEPEGPTPDSGGPELPTRHAILPEGLAGSTPTISIPPARLPDFGYADRRAEMEMRLIDESPDAWLHGTLPHLDAVVEGLEGLDPRLSPDATATAERIREDLAIVRDPEASLDSLDAATRRLSQVLRQRRHYPEGHPDTETLYLESVLAFYRDGTAPTVNRGASETVRPPGPGIGEAQPELAPDIREEEGRSELLAEIESFAGRQVEGFSDLARNTREALQRHDAERPTDSDRAALRVWTEERSRILENYGSERARLVRDLVARHEDPGRRVLEFLQGLNSDDALWGDLEEMGIDRARIASDIPPHGRPKADSDVLAKIERRGWHSILPFTDLFATRIVVEDYHDAIAVMTAIRQRMAIRHEYTGDGRLVFPSHRRVRRPDGSTRVYLNQLEHNRPVIDQERIGRVLDGRRSGYRALHVVVEVDGMPVEIQIHTRSLYRWGQIQHDFYKNDALARPENADIRQATDRYFAEAARCLAAHEQGVLNIERPHLPEFSEGRLSRLPEANRDQITHSLREMEALLDERLSVDLVSSLALRPEAIREAHEEAVVAAIDGMDSETDTSSVRDELSTALASPVRSSVPPDPYDGGNALHSSFLGAGLMVAMTSMGHSSGTSLFAGILGTLLPIGILGVFRWVRGRLGTTPRPSDSSGSGSRSSEVGPPVEPQFQDFSVSAEDGSTYVFRPYTSEPGNAPWRYIASVDRVLPSSTPDRYQVTFAVMRQAAGEAPSMVTIEIPAREVRTMGLVNDMGHTQRGARVYLDRSSAPPAETPVVPATSGETIALEAAPRPVQAPPPNASERPLLQANTMGGNIPEIDAHLGGHILSPEQLAEILSRNSRRARLSGGEIVYLATQGIDPKHPVGEDFMGGMEHRDPLGRRVYSMMIADGMGGMGNGDAAATLTVEAFTEELRRSGDIRRAWSLANAVVREFNRAYMESRDREAALAVARIWIREPRRVVPGSGARGAGSCSVSFSVVSPSRPGEPYVLQSHFAGDASLRLFRRGPDGRYRRVYATVEENLGAVTADTLQDRGDDLRRTREIRLHPMANQVTNGVGTQDSLQLSDTSRGEIPQDRGRVARAEGYENGIVLQEGDLVLAGSDGFWENFIDTSIVGDLLQGTRSAEEAHRILREETHARMEIVRRVRARELPPAGNGRFRFEHRGREWFIDRQYNIYESETAREPVDKFKPDNFSLAVYLHRPEAAASTRLAPTPPPIPEAARQQRRAPPPQAVPAPVVAASSVGPASAELVIAPGEHLYRVMRGGAKLGESTFIYQLRLDSVAGPEAPLFQEIESPRALNTAEIEAILAGRRPPGVAVREGWNIADLRHSGRSSDAIEHGAIPLSLLPNTPGMASVQVDLYALPNDRTPIDTASTNPRATLIDPSISVTSGREPLLSLNGRSESSGDPSRRQWVLHVSQTSTPIFINDRMVLPIKGFTHLREGDRIRVGLSEFVFRDQSLVPETTVPLRVSVPPQPQEVEFLPIAAAPRGNPPTDGE